MADRTGKPWDGCCNQSHRSERNQRRQENPDLVVAIHQKTSRPETGHSLQSALVDQLSSSYNLV